MIHHLTLIYKQFSWDRPALYKIKKRINISQTILESFKNNQTAEYTQQVRDHGIHREKERLCSLILSVVGSCKKIENGVVGASKKVGDAFAGMFLTREGESVEGVKKRLSGEQGHQNERA